MSQNLRVATWIPIADPTAVGSTVRSTAAADVNERIPTEFAVAAGGGAALAVSDTSPSSPADGTLWWESDTGKLYIRYNDGSSTQWVLAHPIGGSGTGSASISVSDTPPASPIDNMLWWESDTGKLYIRYNDGTSVQWVLANPITTPIITRVLHGQENRLRAIEGLPPLSLQEFRTESGL